MAKANASLMNKPVVLAPVRLTATAGRRRTSSDPFAVPMAEKLDLIRNAAEEAKKARRSSPPPARWRPQRGQVLRFLGGLSHSAAQSADLRQRQFHRGGCCEGHLARPAIPAHAASRRARNTSPSMNLEENAQRIREEVVEHLNAPPVKAGKKDLVLMPSHLWLTIHESSATPPNSIARWATRRTTPAPATSRRTRSAKRIASEHVNVRGRPHAAERASPPWGTTTTA